MNAATSGIQLNAQTLSQQPAMNTPLIHRSFRDDYTGLVSAGDGLYKRKLKVPSTTRCNKFKWCSIGWSIGALIIFLVYKLEKPHVQPTSNGNLSLIEPEKLVSESQLIQKILNATTPQTTTPEIPSSTEPQELVTEILNTTTPQTTTPEIPSSTEPQELVTEIPSSTEPQEEIFSIFKSPKPEEPGGINSIPQYEQESNNVEDEPPPNKPEEEEDHDNQPLEERHTVPILGDVIIRNKTIIIDGGNETIIIKP
ncbi:hypothetical protein MIV037L [Invertebrate iridescent virus 3]|uniref:Uncharacterized protein 037L n=1 Tax=Invertebrate iridescent virus 3 TaxID=345201 RepID=037L_IIV3|nr:hypothetical protein MIV037L [Invertebrate iridescent virus 3]Q197C3.1 RecName: Full=Uncharacterized protein 037L [Invertebrate iridescent virus 3]ABF82067.1 hypothetical protein MIV037L [Invertebrate iridescent virus 3]